MESNNPWRIAETKSFHDVADSCNWDLIATDAAGLAAKQVADVDSMIAQGIYVLFLPPREEKPLVPAVMKARAAGIPTFLADRSVDPNVARPGKRYVAFLGSDNGRKPTGISWRTRRNHIRLEGRFPIRGKGPGTANSIVLIPSGVPETQHAIRLFPKPTRDRHAAATGSLRPTQPRSECRVEPRVADKPQMVRARSQGVRALHFHHSQEMWAGIPGVCEQGPP